KLPRCEVAAMKLLSRLMILGALLGGWVAVPPDPGQHARGAEPKPVGYAEAAPTPEQVAFFEKNIRPVLVRECYSCHAKTAEKVKGGFLLDTREGLRKGGEKGPAIVPGEPKESLLITALKHIEGEIKMPPKKKLGDDVVADFEKWVAMGAPDPRDGSITK